MHTGVFGITLGRLRRCAERTMRMVVWAGLVVGPTYADCAPESDVPTDINYRLGTGLHVPDTGLILGGYATASVDELRGQPLRATADHASLFIWWEGSSQWKVFSEIDYENLLSTARPADTEQARRLVLERLYADYALTPDTSIRGGKFLTPIGRWNLIHATPLVWTTSRPLVTTMVFPTNVTGLMLNGTMTVAGTRGEYALYGADGQELHPNPNLDPFQDVVGAHVTLPLSDRLRVGMSYAVFEQERSPDERKHLQGLDVQWSAGRVELSGEGVFRRSEKGAAWNEKGAFVQLVAPLAGTLYAVGRYETFRAATSTTAQYWVGGLNYRITPAVVAKAEWIHARNNTLGAPEGFLSSISVLF